jgi:hypothetical protein
VYVPGDATPRLWSFDNDAEKCGSFGVFLGLHGPNIANKCDVLGVGTGDNCCKVDEAVAIHYQVLSACISCFSSFLLFFLYLMICY